MNCGCHFHNGFVLGRSPEGLAQREMFSEGDLIRSGKGVRLDTQGSVSGLRRDETMLIFNDGVIDEQYRRFLELELSEGECF